jgi:hypothetical protein
LKTQVANRDLGLVAAGQGRDVEERPHLVAALYPDIGDEGLEKGLSRWPVASGEDLADTPSQGCQGCRVGDGLGVGCQQGFELLLAGVELVALGVEAFEARSAEVGGHVAVLEGGEVAVDRLVGSVEFGLDSPKFGGIGVMVRVGLAGRLCDGALEQVDAAVCR